MDILENVSLKDLTTIKAGGVARYFVEVGDESELQKAVGFAKERKLKIFVLGGGSDILVSDKGLDALVIKYLGKKVALDSGGDDVFVTAEAGLTWDKLVEMVVRKGLQGVECLSGIPGMVGASPIQNIGAYGQELKDTFVKLRAYDTQKEEFIELNKEDCQFNYRESVFKSSESKGRYIITKVTLRLTTSNKPDIKYQSLVDYLQEKGLSSPTLQQVRAAVLDIRSHKFENPKILPNAGSFFKNPIVDKNIYNKLIEMYPEMPSFPVGKQFKLFAGWLIEQAGWKGKKHKSAKVSDMHALILTNPGGKASASEIKELAEKIIKDVDAKFGVKLMPEVQFVGF